MTGAHLFPKEWRLAEIGKASMPWHGARVFSCFSGGGGSSMGYKLAGYDVVGGCELDEKMAGCYERNLRPRLFIRGDIRDMVSARSLPPELYGLDVLDGSPPCSVFSLCGDREKNWGKEKVFREGQKRQVLDTLFFDFVALAARLRPKAVVAENVEGMVRGRAAKYAAKVLSDLEAAGYLADWRLLRAEKMGVPQKRHRAFFYALRKDLCGAVGTLGMSRPAPRLDLAFGEPPIPFRKVSNGKFTTARDKHLKPGEEKMFDYLPPGTTLSLVHPKGYYFGWSRTHPDRPVNTIVAAAKDKTFHYADRRLLNRREITVCGTFPLDYDFGGMEWHYVIGMSVPPVMAAQVAWRVKTGWLNKVG